MITRTWIIYNLHIHINTRLCWAHRNNVILKAPQKGQRKGSVFPHSCLKAGLLLFVTLKLHFHVVFIIFCLVAVFYLLQATVSGFLYSILVKVQAACYICFSKAHISISEHVYLKMCTYTYTMSSHIIAFMYFYISKKNNFVYLGPLYIYSYLLFVV